MPSPTGADPRPRARGGPARGGPVFGGPGRRWPWMVALLGVTFAVRWGVIRWSELWAERLGRAAAALSGGAPTPDEVQQGDLLEAPDPEVAPAEPVLEEARSTNPDANTPATPLAPANASPRRATSRAPTFAAPSANAHSVHLAADQVLKMAQMGLAPRATPVSARGHRPAGLQLFGVTGLGLGLTDGDVLTHLDGAPVVSRSDAVQAAVGARGRRASAIRARVQRASGAQVLVVIEQPYPTESEWEALLRVRDVALTPGRGKL